MFIIWVLIRVRTYCGVLPLGSYIFRTTPGKHGELHSNVVDIHELEGKNGPYIKPQIMSGLICRLITKTTAQKQMLLV